jgi:pimeloyl-ACP methyl ester carboxylesterase/DNA-binding winged helix-turn-helix (wHTH) protein
MHAENNTNCVELPGFVFDLEHEELRATCGARVALRAQVFSVLRCLARRPGALVTKDELMHAVWPRVVVTEDSLVQCIGELRRALHDDTHRIVVTEARRGYRLVPSQGVQASSAEGPQPFVFHQDIRFVTVVGGARIAYATSGRGMPVVRAAHWMTHLDWDWRSATLGPRIQALSRLHQLVRYDGRGYGLSDTEIPPATLDQSVDDLDAVVESAGLDRFALLGTSGGAAVAIRYAARHPQRVTGLLLLGGYARGLLRRSQGSAAAENFNAMLRLLEDGWAQDNPAFRQLMTSLHWPGATLQQMQSFNELQRVSCGPKTAVDMLRRNAEFDASEDLSAVSCPTLVMHSPRDARVPFEEGRRIAAAISGARLEPFDSPNHTPLSGEPAFEHVQQLIEDFLLDLGVDQPSIERHARGRLVLHAVDGGRTGAPDSLRASKAS